MAHPRRIQAGHRAAETRAQRVQLPDDRFDEELLDAAARLRAVGRQVTVGALLKQLRDLNYQAGKQTVEASAARVGIDVSNPDGAARAQKALRTLRENGRY